MDFGMILIVAFIIVVGAIIGWALYEEEKAKREYIEYLERNGYRVIHIYRM